VLGTTIKMSKQAKHIKIVVTILSDVGLKSIILVDIRLHSMKYKAE
jgi:hypothetical protein